MGKPIIRFKGYEDDWEQRKLGEMADIVGGGTPSTSNDDYWDGDIDWYAPAEIADQIYVSSSERKITQQGYENSPAKMLPVGTVLFTSRAGIGKTAILRKEGCTNQGFQSIVPHENMLDSYFIFSRTEELKRYGETTGAGSTFVEVSGKQMASMELMMPKTVEEQKAIGLYFQNLDHLITLHQRKCEQTKILKKYMLQKMFPQNGEKVPEIRFSGFTDDWEQRKFGDIAQSFEYGLNAPAKEYDGTNKYLRITDIDDVSRKFNTDNLTSPDIELSTAKNYRLLDGDILFARTGASVGKSFIYRDADGIVYFAGFLIRARIKAGYDVEFVFQNTLCESYGKYIQITSQRSGQPGVNAKEYSDYVFNLPTYDEQKKIGNFLHQIDNLITLHQRKCDELQKIKKFMLQNMFV